MKAFLILLVGIIALSSCNKKKCYSCTSVTTYDQDTSMLTHPSSITYDYCDWTKEQAKAYEENSTHYSNGVHLSTNCVIK